MDVSEKTVSKLGKNLAACKDRFSKIFDASPSSIAISTLETGYHYAVNDVWLKTMGYERDEVVGKTAGELGVWLTPQDRVEYINAFVSAGALRNYDHQLRTKNGEVRSFSTSCDEINYDGEPRLLMVFHDVTERKKAEDALRRANENLERQIAERTQELQRQVEATERAMADLEGSEQSLMDANSMLTVVLDTIPVRIFWKDLDLNLLGCNGLLAMDAGFQNPRKMIGKSDYEMGWRDQADLYRADDREVINSQKPKLGFEEPQTTPDGRKIWLRTSKSPLRNLDGDVIGVLGMYEDITQRKAAEKELRDAHQEAERANLAKTQFLSSMSHELRTPLNAILGFAQLLEYDPAHPLSEAQKESVEHIKTGGQHLSKLINEILELAKIEAGHLELNVESIDPQRVFKEIIPMAETMAKKYDLKFIAPQPTQPWPRVLVDAMRLKQVLLNLLSNAMKYNVAGGSVSMSCIPVEGALHFKVSDTGLGISAEGMEDLFQPFARLGHENSKIEGTGIGLSITRELVEHMDGKIGVDTALGEGSTFWVRFPLAQPGASGGAVAAKADRQHVSDV